MHQYGYGLLSDQPGHLLQKQVSFDTGDGDLRAIGHFDITAFLPNIFLHEFKVDQVGVVKAEKIPVGQQILVFLQVP
jgi:hypothetical protein